MKAFHRSSGIGVLVHDIRPRLHWPVVRKWTIRCSINGSHLFITCVIAIDLPEAVSGGFAVTEYKALCANIIHYATKTLLYCFLCRC